jgi:hypothetical protein
MRSMFQRAPRKLRFFGLSPGDWSVLLLGCTLCNTLPIGSLLISPIQQHWEAGLPVSVLKRRGCEGQAVKRPADGLPLIREARAGTPCQRPAIRGRTRCRLHGGLSPGAPRGFKNGNFRNGNWTADAIAERRWLQTLVRSFATTG